MNILRKDLPSDDETDEDYEPTTKEIQEDEKDMKKNQRKPLEKDRKKISEIWEEMKFQEEQKLKDQPSEDTLTLDKVKELIERARKDQPKPQVIRFAGKTFDLGENNEYKILEPNENEEKPKEEVVVKPEPIETEDLSLKIERERLELTMSMAKKKEYLKNLLKVIEAKNINSMMKSKYDWKEYTQKVNMEKQFTENRKDGYIEKQKFLEKAKYEEKQIMKSKKKVKF